MTLVSFPHGCNATTCPNGKCRATSECQDALPRVASSPMIPEGYCTETGDAWCYAATITEAGQCATCPERPAGFSVAYCREIADARRQTWKEHQVFVSGATPSPSLAATLPLPSDSAARKNVPMASGLLDYFPDALAEIAHVSYLGNEKHNPGEPLHHARGKSMDHADCIIRHLTERGSRDPAGVRHTAQMAWRALALLQEELENDLGLPLPRGARS